MEDFHKKYCVREIQYFLENFKKERGSFNPEVLLGADAVVNSGPDGSSGMGVQKQ